MLTLDLARNDLERLISRHWGGELGEARRNGVDPERIGAKAAPDGKLYWWLEGKAPLRAGEPEAASAALRGLLLSLEDDGLVIDWERGAVKGWAAVASQWGDPRDKVRKCRNSYLIAVADLDPRDPRRSSYFSSVLSAREVRRAPMAEVRAEKLRRYGR